MKKKFINYWEIFIIFIFSLTPLLWLKNNQIIIGHDSGFRLNILEYFESLFYSWSPLTNFGVDWSIFKGFLVAQLPEALFAFITSSLVNGQRLSFVFWFFIIGMSMYTLIRQTFPQKSFWVFRLFSSIFYMYNFFLLQGWFIAERAKFSLFAALPLGLLLIYKILKKKYPLIKGGIIFSLVLFLLNSGGNPTHYGSLILVYLIAFLYLTLINCLRNGKKEIIFSIKTALVLLIGTVLINAYWILPQIYLTVNKYTTSLLSVGGISGILGWEDVVDKSASYINLLRLQGIPDWYNNINNTYSNYFINNPTLIIFSFVPIFTILLGLYFYKKLNPVYRNDELFYLVFLIFLVGIIFTAGSHPPLGFFYIFLIKYLPGFAIFRSAFYKFGPTLWFSIIFLTGYLLNLFLITIKNKKYVYFLVGIVVVVFVPLYHFPYFISNFFVFNKPFTTRVTVPDYVNDASTYIDKEIPKGSRILILPKLDSSFSADSYDWGFWSLDILPRISTSRSIIANNNSSLGIVTNIYNAIDNNDEAMFLRLTGLTGIDKILWRDDVLYSDKTTKSSDLKITEGIVKNFKSISLEKEFGKWKIYKINNPYYQPLFNISEKLFLANSGSDIIGSVFSLQNEPNSSFVFFDNESQDLINNLDILIEGKYFQTDCSLCNLNTIRSLTGSVVIPVIRFLPDSPFYFAVSNKEQKLLEEYKYMFSQKIDADLGFANKRLAEVRQILFRDFEINSPQLVKETLSKYKMHMSDVLSNTDKLSGIDKNNYLIKIYAYLKAHDKFLKEIRNKDSLALSDFENLSIFVKEQISKMENGLWMSTADNQIRIIFNLEKDGNFDLIIQDKNILPEKIVLDAKKIDNIDNLFLSKGIHKIEIDYPKSRELVIDKDGIVNGIIGLDYGQEKNFSIPDFDYQYAYLIRFDYKVNEGRGPNIVIKQDNDLKDDDGREVRKIKEILSGDGQWHHSEYVFNPNSGAKEAGVGFQLLGFDDRASVFQVKNLMADKIFNPRVFLRQNINNEYAPTAKAVFKKSDPTEYVVQVSNANGPYILNFGESFDKGWKAYIPSDNKFISESNHIKINGYANGWLIDKQGDYDVIIRYWPQKIFRIGLLISAVSVLIYTIFFLFINKNDKKN